MPSCIPAAVEINDELLADINRVLKSTNGFAGYYVGIVCALAWSDHKDPSGALLERAAQCETIGQVDELYIAMRKDKSAYQARKRRRIFQSKEKPN